MPNVYVCRAGDPSFLGQYVPISESMNDGVPTFENEEGRAIWRHQVENTAQLNSTPQAIMSLQSG